MADNSNSKPLEVFSPSEILGSPSSLRNPATSAPSASASPTVDKEQLAQALDKIHNSASQSDSLTTFNDFAPLPDGIAAAESRSTTGEIVQHGLSGLYSRFREAVGAGSPAKTSPMDHTFEHADAIIKRTSTSGSHASRPSISSLGRAETSFGAGTVSSQSAPATEVLPSSALVATTSSDSRSQVSQSSKTTSISLLTGQKSHPAYRQSLPTKATSTVVADPTITAPISVHRDASRSTVRTDDSSGQGSSRPSLSRVEIHTRVSAVDSSGMHDHLKDGKILSKSGPDEASSIEGSSVDAPPGSFKSTAPTSPAAQGRLSRSRSDSSSLLLPPDPVRRMPAVIDRISRPKSPRLQGSRESSRDRGTAEASPVNTAAHGTIFHDSFSQDSHSRQAASVGNRIPGTTAGHQGASDQMSAHLDKMRRQILSKEFWMKDDTVKECFLCQTPFTAFRRKHHCRMCGCIFDSKCTTVVSGAKLGIQGSLRVCKRCLEVMSRRLDGSGSDDSGDERSFMPKIFGPKHHPKSSSFVGQAGRHAKEQESVLVSEGSEDARPISTPMMAIPAARRVNQSSRASAVLEIDAVQLSRPGSSRSLRSLGTTRPQSSAGHKRHHSKHGFLGRLKTSEDRAPFRKVDDESMKKSKFPAFHDDNIIDPELADYMSEDSSGDEQMSIFATMAMSDLQPASFEQEKSGFFQYVNPARKQRHRAGEKSVSGMSYISRGVLDDVNGPASLMSHRRPNRRRNLSNVSSTAHHLPSPRPKSAVYKGPSASSEMLFQESQGTLGSPSMAGVDALRKQKAPKEKLNGSSLNHVDKLLLQLLTDAKIPSSEAWQKALVPILLKLTDDVSPDVAKGEDMDIRHYVKLKKIPGGKPGDTSYVSGVVFTKNLALKSMPRRILNPRIVLITFPIEYQRHQQHFMSLQPVIEQEKEFLRVVVQRITNLRPHVLLAQRSVSGVALQYLSEANISVAYNVKDTVIEAVARCAEAEIIESLDMLALSVRVGRCSAFEVRTFVNNDYSGRKKSYIFLSGCRADLGCTIALRGANSVVLSKVKLIMEFMVYVVYNLKLESSLLRDECIDPPDVSDSSSLSSHHAAHEILGSQSGAGVECTSVTGNGMAASLSTGSGGTGQETIAESAGAHKHDEEARHPNQVLATTDEHSKLVRLHEQHSHVSQEGQGQVPDDIPMPTFYSDMVAKYETKILSASPYVKFKQPYLLMKAREQERRLNYLRRLRDQDAVEEDAEKSGPQRFQLIKPEMVEKIGQKAPRQIMEILHAVHDAEYDKALVNYQTQTRQWETYIQGNLDLFDPYSHQNIIVLYSVICTETKIPCLEPNLLAINFYDEQHVDTGMDPDCTLGQYIEDLAYSRNDICNSNGCEKTMMEHHRTYVHDQYRITVFVEKVLNAQPRRAELGDGITMWTYCKLCKKDSEELAMSEVTYKYSFGKYLELLYWGRGMKMARGTECPHELNDDHIRYFSLGNSRIRIHLDPIDLLEIVVPRARITWKVVNDLRLKNEIFAKMEERLSKFMSSVRLRLKSIRIDSVLPEKAEACKAEVERLMKRSQEEQPAMVRQLQSIYVNSKYYEVVPFNSLVREMLEKAGEWDQEFAKFEADFLGDKDLRQLTIMQLKKMFSDGESKESLTPTDCSTGLPPDGDERSHHNGPETDEKLALPNNDTEAGSQGATNPGAESKSDADADGSEAPADLASIKTVESSNSTASSTAAQVAEAPPVVLSAIEGEAKSPSRIPAPTQRPSMSVLGAGRSSTDEPLRGPSLSAKVDQKRREQAMQPVQQQPGGTSAATGETRDTPAGKTSISNAAPPILRTISQPPRTLPRASASVGKTLGTHDEKNTGAGPHTESSSEGLAKADKKLSDRIGLISLKSRGKGGSSSIPRLANRRESRVSTLARHFEQLSREFEKERIRDRKERAASLRQPRARLPRTSTKAIVQVYDDLNEAFEEPSLPNDAAADGQGELKSTNLAANTTSETNRPEPPPTAIGDNSKQESLQSGGEMDDGSQTNMNHGATEDDGGGSDAESGMPYEFFPDIKELADALEPSTDIPLELPKHQKTSLMKYLTNFWAERSASGWPPLEYPVNATDHIFVDSDIIVREDEPSSVIALALNSRDYQDKLAAIRREAQEVAGFTQTSRAATAKGVAEKGLEAVERINETKEEGKRGREEDYEDEKMEEQEVGKLEEEQMAKEDMMEEEEGGDRADDDEEVMLKEEEAADHIPAAAAGGAPLSEETELERSLLRVTGTHLKYQFKEGAAVMTCKIFYTEQFDALRRKCGVAERVIESLSRCLKWDSRGGKTKSVFLKTLDDRLVLKSLSPVETSAFLRFAPGYFNIMAAALFHDLPSVIAKMLGFFQVIIKNPMTGTDIKLDLLVTENLFYDRSPTRIFDLKGSMRNRRIQSTGEQNEVLLDENMVEYIYESPLFAREHSKKLLRASVWNDTLFLARQNVMDYSLMVAVDEERKELVVGIIDCIRTYTWDKKLESWIKDRGFAGGGRNRPTVTSPKEYKSRFREAMARYILQSPNCWHLFNAQIDPVYYGRARFEEPEGKV